jgi:type VII secretion protein EccE
VSQSLPVPGAGRLTLALLAIVPAAMAHPWHSTRAYWLIGIAVVAVIVLFGWWRGLYLTTIVRRRLAMMRRPADPAPADELALVGPDARATSVLRIGPAAESDMLPLPLFARYLDRYGIRADKIRVTSRDTALGEAETWVGLTLSAADNLAALQARSSRIPLHATAEVAVRRLADHLRELGWEATVVAPEELPELLAPNARETWRGVVQDAHFLAAYRVSTDASLPETLDALRSQGARETWTALEIAGPDTAEARHTVAVACGLLTDSTPVGVPVAGVTPQNGRHRPALAALDLLSVERLDGHVNAPDGLLEDLRWPTPAAGAHAAATVEAAITR